MLASPSNAANPLFNCPSAKYLQITNIVVILQIINEKNVYRKKDTRSGFRQVCRCWDKPTQML
jgi:hypothetical protein